MQLSALAALSLGRYFPVHIGLEFCWLQDYSGCCGEKGNTLLMPEFKPQFIGLAPCSLVAEPSSSADSVLSETEINGNRSCKC